MLERREGLAHWTEHHIQEIQWIRPHVSSTSSDQSTQLGHLSHLDSRYHSRSNKTTTPSYVDYVWKLCFYVGTRQRIFLFSDDYYSDSTVILTTIAVKQCMDIGTRSHVCLFLFNYLSVCLNSRRWFVPVLGLRLYCHVVRVTIDGVWIGEWIYWPLTGRSTNKYNTIAISIIHISLLHN
jgi:hypothetical protein